MVDLNSFAQEVHQDNWDTVVISVSGGKDSSALMAWAVENFPKSKLVAVHAVIDIDWKSTLPIVREQCKQFDIPLVEVQAVRKDGSKNGFLTMLTSVRKNRKTGELGEYSFPSQGNRWCTSVLKIGPIDKYLRSIKGNTLCLIGERREESSQRSKLEAYRPDHKNSKNGRRIVKFSPILDLSEKEVWDIIDHYQIAKHPCYSWGVSRASCAICIFSSKKEIAIAYEKERDIVEKYLEAESKISHTFRYQAKTKKRPEIKTTVRDILQMFGYHLPVAKRPVA